MEARSALVLTAILVLAAVETLAAECPVELPSGDHPATAYGPRAGGYCDGQLAEPHGGRLRILAVRTPGGEASAEPPLAIDIATGASAAAGPILLQGLPLDATVNYRFDASLDATKLPLVVGADAALWRLGLASGQVGWAAWAQKPGEERVYLPVEVGGGDRQRVEIVLSSVLEVAVLRARVHAPTGESRTDSAMSAGPNEPFSFLLAAGPEGLVTIDLVVEGADGVSSESASVRLWRPKP